ncbi:hypothetical protein [Geodermatophilus sp. SYSU D01105]
MRLLRAVVVAAVGVASVLFAPEAPAAETRGQAQCERVWIWWIPFPCQPD